MGIEQATNREHQEKSQIAANQLVEARGETKTANKEVTRLESEAAELAFKIKELKDTIRDRDAELFKLSDAQRAIAD